MFQIQPGPVRKKNVLDQAQPGPAREVRNFYNRLLSQIVRIHEISRVYIISIKKNKRKFKTRLGLAQPGPKYLISGWL